MPDLVQGAHTSRAQLGPADDKRGRVLWLPPPSLTGTTRTSTPALWPSPASSTTGASVVGCQAQGACGLAGAHLPQAKLLCRICICTFAMHCAGRTLSWQGIAQGRADVPAQEVGHCGHMNTLAYDTSFAVLQFCMTIPCLPRLRC